MVEEKALTTVKIFKHRLPQLQLISAMTGKSQLEIVDGYLKDLFDTVQPLVSEASFRKLLIKYDTTILAAVWDHKDVVSGSRMVPMDEPDAKTRADTLKEIEAKFAAQEKPKKKVKK
jgi:hypothetical protein